MARHQKSGNSQGPQEAHPEVVRDGTSSRPGYGWLAVLLAVLLVGGLLYYFVFSDDPNAPDEQFRPGGEAQVEDT